MSSLRTSLQQLLAMSRDPYSPDNLMRMRSVDVHLDTLLYNGHTYPMRSLLLLSVFVTFGDVIGSLHNFKVRSRVIIAVIIVVVYVFVFLQFPAQRFFFHITWTIFALCCLRFRVVLNND